MRLWARRALHEAVLNRLIFQTDCVQTMKSAVRRPSPMEMKRTISLSGDEECQAQRVPKDPGMPSQKDIDEHVARGHATYRTWCEACVEGRGAGEPHLRDEKQDPKIPILAFDCFFVIPGGDIKTRDGVTPPEMEGCKLKTLIAIDTTAGSTFSNVVGEKGVEDDRYSVDEMVGDTEWLGYSQIASRVAASRPQSRS